MRSIRALGPGDRRSWRRYRVALALRWKLLLGSSGLESGTGVTLDLSSHGMLFQTDGEIRPGVGIEVSVAWPVLLSNLARLQLLMAGEVVRTASGCVAVRIRHHEFRTVAKLRPVGPSASLGNPIQESRVMGTFAQSWANTPDVSGP